MQRGAGGPGDPPVRYVISVGYARKTHAHQVGSETSTHSTERKRLVGEGDCHPARGWQVSEVVSACGVSFF